MHSDTAPLKRTVRVAAAALILAIAVTYLLTVAVEHPMLGRRPRLAFLLRVKLLVTTFNVMVLMVLTGVYVNVYRELPNQFTLSLVLFSLALLLYALTSNPVVPIVLGYGGGPQIGPFTFIPDLFASVAIVVLLNQSYR